MKQSHTTVRLELCNQANATFTLRRALDRVARECHLTDEARFELKLAATEALTNAMKGAPREHAVEVVISGDEGAVDVEVVDRGRFEPRLREDTSLDAEGGRGIPLMLALVDEVEFASAGDGTRVRMSKRVPREGEAAFSF
jgi:anti-sigma regulatory factor (Ser/Thr protein kinase)